VEGNMDRRVSASACSTLRSLRPWHVGTLFAWEPGGLLLGRFSCCVAVRSGRRGVEADEARAGEVRPLHIGNEAGEQTWVPGSGAGGAIDFWRVCCSESPALANESNVDRETGHRHAKQRAKRGSAAPAICPGCSLLVRPIFRETNSGNGKMPSATPQQLALAIVETSGGGARILKT
jgi:hypothetical protein